MVVPLEGEAAGSLAGRILAVLSLLLGCIPILNLAIGGTAWYLNRKTVGWPRWVSIVGTALALLVTIALLFIIIFDPGKT